MALAVICAAGPVLAQVSIATGSDPSADGYLRVGVDATGSWSSSSYGSGIGDTFNPAGPLTEMEVAFSTGLFLFADNGDRELLTQNATFRGVTNDTTIRNPIITNALTASDTDGDGVNDTATSSFDLVNGVSGSGLTNLSVDVIQRVSVDRPGVSAFLQQDYTFTNNAANSITLNLVRAFDGDLLWTDNLGTGGFCDDEVGTTMHGAGLGTYVYEQEDTESPHTAMTLSSPNATIYYGGKRGVDPLGGGLPFGYGTDTQVWDELGTPANWVNFIAGVGANLNGESGQQPPGSTSCEDGFVGIEIVNLVLPPGESSQAITILYTYGATQPPSPGPDCDFTGDGLCDVDDINALGVEVIAGTNDPAFDLNGDTFVNNLDRNEWLAQAAAENGFSEAYQLGDSNLDGIADGQDFVEWNSEKFGPPGPSTPWSDADWDFNNFVDGGDFTLWNGNKFDPISASAIPEPSSLLTLVLALGLFAGRRRM
jgi:hypothetical protein